MSSNSSNDNNDCYFRINTVIDNDVIAGNVNTEDISCSTFQSNESLYVGGNAVFDKGPVANAQGVTVQGVTNASGYDLTTTQKIDIDLQNNRLSNVKQPTDDCSPVPANYLVTPEYFYTSLKEMNFFWREPGKIPLIGENRLNYQSKDIFNHIRFVDVDTNTYKVTPGTTCIQFLSKGIYMIDFGITKRWGWNNGFGGNVYIKDFASTKMISGTSVASGGGYSGQGCMGAAIQIQNVNQNPNTLLTDNDKASVIYVDLESGGADFCSLYLGIIFYEHKV